MILIISNNDDISTSDVIDWLAYYDIEFCRINMDEFNELSITTTVNNKDIETEIYIPYLQKKINSNKIKSIWYRRSSEIQLPKFTKVSNQKLKKSIQTHLFTEIKYFKSAVWHSLKNTKWLNNFETIYTDKFVALTEAKNCGLKIPNTILTTSKENLLLFFDELKEIIIKPIYNMEFLRIDDVSYLQYTSKLRREDIENLLNITFPILCQEFIRKEYEIRTFVIDEKIFSMAIFSQDDEQTSVDFRRYNENIPNRTVSFKLPNDIEEKIFLFMKKMNMNSGSIDFIMSNKKELIFLEVNSVGQFGMTSFPCNYFLEKEIAQFLSK